QAAGRPGGSGPGLSGAKLAAGPGGPAPPPKLDAAPLLGSSQRLPRRLMRR
ncbi:hypothetical protein HaLaN_32924, partial [Haematococcus lacustris]